MKIRFVVLISALICAGIANAGDLTNSFIIQNGTIGAVPAVKVPACVDSFKDLPAVAERLHVSPVDSARSRIVILTMCDGRAYDFMELINAMLDRLDQVAQRAEKKPRCIEVDRLAADAGRQSKVVCR